MNREQPVFHISYIQSHNFVTWQELVCLSKALGYPSSVLKLECEKFVETKETGVTLIDLQTLCKLPEFQETMGYTYNQHTYEWNTDLILTSIRLCSHRALTLDEIRTVRIAYTFLESEKGDGLTMKEKNLLACLKMCKRIISPMKMMHRLKHMKARFKIPGFLQIKEFLELILWCDLYTACEEKVKKWEIVHGKDAQLCWKLNEFMEFLQVTDTKMRDLLNLQYLKEEWDFIREKIKGSRELHDPPVLNKIREEQTARHRALYEPLNKAIEQSNSDLCVGRARGHQSGQRPKTASAILGAVRADQDSIYPPPPAPNDEEEFLEGMQERPYSAKEIIDFYTDQLPRKDDRENYCSVQTETVKSHSPETFKRLKRPKTAPCFANIDKNMVSRDMASIQFDMDSAEIRYDYCTREDLEFLRPGFWRRYAKRPKPVPPPTPPPPRTPRLKRPSNDFLKRIASAHTRQPSPHHGHVCDARFFGVESISTGLNIKYRTKSAHGCSEQMPREDTSPTENDFSNIIGSEPKKRSRAKSAGPPGILQLRGVPKWRAPTPLPEKPLMPKPPDRNMVLYRYLDQALSARSVSQLVIEGHRGFRA